MPMELIQALNVLVALSALVTALFGIYKAGSVYGKLETRVENSEKTVTKLADELGKINGHNADAIEHMESRVDARLANMSTTMTTAINNLTSRIDILMSRSKHE